MIKHFMSKALVVAVVAFGLLAVPSECLARRGHIIEKVYEYSSTDKKILGCLRSIVKNHIRTEDELLEVMKFVDDSLGKSIPHAFLQDCREMKRKYPKQYIGRMKLDPRRIGKITNISTRSVALIEALYSDVYRCTVYGTRAMAGAIAGAAAGLLVGECLMKSGEEFAVVVPNIAGGFALGAVISAEGWEFGSNNAHEVFKGVGVQAAALVVGDFHADDGMVFGGGYSLGIGEFAMWQAGLKIRLMRTGNDYRGIGDTYAAFVPLETKMVRQRYFSFDDITQFQDLDE